MSQSNYYITVEPLYSGHLYIADKHRDKHSKHREKMDKHRKTQASTGKRKQTQTNTGKYRHRQATLR